MNNMKHPIPVDIKNFYGDLLRFVVLNPSPLKIKKERAEELKKSDNILSDFSTKHLMQNAKRNIEEFEMSMKDYIPLYKNNFLTELQNKYEVTSGKTMYALELKNENIPSM